MNAYNKLFAAIISTFVSRWMLVYFGLDVETLGVAHELQAIVTLSIDTAVAAFNGFWVWLLPNGWPFWKRVRK